MPHKKLSSFYVLLAAFMWLTGCEEFADETASLQQGPQGIVNGTPVDFSSPEDQIWWGTVAVNSRSCTGSLIDPEVVLTAAHCINGSNYTIYVGEQQETQIASSVQVISHPQFSMQNFLAGYDVALIKLNTPITDYPCYKVRTESQAPVGTVGIAVGYGDTGFQQGNVGTLRKGELAITDYRTNGALVEIGEPAGMCNGDSGGPYFTTQNGEWVVTGITSTGDPPQCLTTGNLDTSTYHYQDWINEKMIELVGHGLAETGCGEQPDTDTGDPETDSDDVNETDSEDTDTGTDEDDDDDDDDDDNNDNNDDDDNNDDNNDDDDNNNNDDDNNDDDNDDNNDDDNDDNNDDDNDDNNDDDDSPAESNGEDTGCGCSNLGERTANSVLSLLPTLF